MLIFFQVAQKPRQTRKIFISECTIPNYRFVIIRYTKQTKRPNTCHWTIDNLENRQSTCSGTCTVTVFKKGKDTDFRMLTTNLHSFPTPVSLHLYFVQIRFCLIQLQNTILSRPEYPYLCETEYFQILLTRII